MIGLDFTAKSDKILWPAYLSFFVLSAKWSSMGNLDEWAKICACLCWIYDELVVGNKNTFLRRAWNILHSCLDNKFINTLYRHLFCCLAAMLGYLSNKTLILLFFFWYDTKKPGLKEIFMEIFRFAHSLFVIPQNVHNRYR